jgi:uncharacterized protein
VDPLQILGLAVVGLLAGVLSSLLGVGGGIVMVPMLHYVLGFGFREATLLSLLAIAFQSPTGVYHHARRGAVDWRIAAPLVLAGAAGVALGIGLAPRVPVPWLKLLLAGLMALAAWRMVAALPPAQGTRPGLPYLAGAGVLAGVISRLLGIGGGLTTVPLLVMGGVAVHVAVGTSLVAVFTNAAVAAAVALAQGLDWMPAVPLVLAALAGVPVGAWLAHSLDENGLRRVFAVGLVLAAVYVAWTSGVL